MGGTLNSPPPPWFKVWVKNTLGGRGLNTRSNQKTKEKFLSVIASAYPRRFKPGLGVCAAPQSTEPFTNCLRLEAEFTCLSDLLFRNGHCASKSQRAWSIDYSLKICLTFHLKPPYSQRTYFQALYILEI